MRNQRTYAPRDHDFYIMELDTGLYVDGKVKGNQSRFINHSCDPNCELVRWNVKGRIRIGKSDDMMYCRASFLFTAALFTAGIFSVRDIQEGEPLSYDYKFDTNESDAFKCHCGTEKCRGTMVHTIFISITL